MEHIFCLKKVYLSLQPMCVLLLLCVMGLAVGYPSLPLVFELLFFGGSVAVVVVVVVMGGSP